MFYTALKKNPLDSYCLLKNVSLELEGCESGKCSARGVCMCESASEWEVEMGLPWWCLLCKIVCLFLASGASYVKT